MKRLVSIFVFVLVALYSYSQVTVEAKIDSVGLLIGHQAHMFVEVTARPGAKILFPIFKRTQNIVPGVEVLSSEDGDSSLIDGFVKKTHVYTITSFDEHLYAIPGVRVKVNGKTFISNSMALKVITCDVDSLHPEKFYPPKSVQDNPFLWSEWSHLFWIGLIVLLLCMIELFMLSRLFQNKPIIARIRIIKHVPPHKKALDEMLRLKSEHFDSLDEQKAYYTKLTGTLRQYIKERFGFNAMEMTSSEILFKLKELGDDNMLSELSELFTIADLVKFAKYSSLLNEKDLNLVNAINFIDSTKRDNEPTEERVMPTLSDSEKRAHHSRLAIKIVLWLTLALVATLLVYIVYNVCLLLQ